MRGPIPGIVWPTLGGILLDTPRGLVFVWTPPGATAKRGTVVYVHGYDTDLRQAITQFRLVDLFRRSGLDAMFVVPAAPSSRNEPVNFPDLQELLGFIRRGSGPVVAVGHSAAYRTIVPWLNDPQLVEVILVDALYEGADQFRAWAAQPPHRFITVGTPAETQAASDRLARVLGAQVLTVVPSRLPDDRVLGFSLDRDHLEVVSTVPALLQHTLIPRLQRRSTAGWVLLGIGLLGVGIWLSRP